MIFVTDMLNHVSVYAGDSMLDAVKARNDYMSLMGLTKNTCEVFAESAKPIAVKGGTTAPATVSHEDFDKYYDSCINDKLVFACEDECNNDNP